MQIDVHLFVFLLVAGVTALCAIATVVAQNIVRSATWLLFTLAGTAGIFFILGADFVGAIQILIYVGGTMVLVVFGVMLTAQGPFIHMKASPAEWAISTIVGLLLFAILCIATARTFLGTSASSSPVSKDEDIATSRHATTIGQALTGAPYGPVRKDDKGPVEASGTHYLLPFEIVSVHLLVVLIGAAYLARTKRRNPATGEKA